MSSSAMRLTLLCLALVVATVSAAQQASRPLAAYGVSRSEVFALKAGQGLVVRPSAPARPGFVIGVEVYDSEKNLLGRDDDEVETPAFEWPAPRDGRYYLVVRNFSPVAGGYTVDVVKPEGTRALRQTAEQAVVKVFYATNRNQATSPSGSLTYQGELREGSDLALGVARVSVPRDHRMGELEGPSILRLEFGQDPERHIVVRDIQPESAQRFMESVRAAASRTARKEAFVFVHGFATSFEDAVRRTAQIAYDLGFEGAPILYSWPSQAKIGLLDYNRDARNAELSAEPLKAFLQQIVAGADLKTVHVIAHSMGNRVVAAALDAVARDSRTQARLPLREIALMAPDIDAQVFRTVADRIKGVPSRVTLYASSGDEALVASQRLAGYPRAGQGGPDVLVMPGIDTIDASQVDTSLLGLGHSYYADNRTILSDLFYLLRGQGPQERASLQQRKNRNGTYWEFRPAAR